MRLSWKGCVGLAKQLSHALDDDIFEIMTPAQKVAFVHEDNSLEHALLVLTQCGYSAIPVLDHTAAIKGIINTTLIVKAIIGIKGYDVEKLGQCPVAQVMLTNVPKIRQTQSLLNALKLSINSPFLCVEDPDGRFVGIITRKNILGKLYQHLSRSAL